jgi:hypothetical protein
LRLAKVATTTNIYVKMVSQEDALPARPNLGFLKKRSLSAAHRFSALRNCDRLVLEVIRVEWRRILWRRWTSAL